METAVNDIVMLTDLDSLLDTRLGVASLFDPSVAIALLKDNWQKRKTDKWQLSQTQFTYDEYRKKYYERTLDAISASAPTALPTMLLNIIHENNVTSMEVNRSIKHKLIVNLDLYPFNQDEVDELQLALEEVLPFFDDIRLVRYPLKQITFSLLRMLGVGYYITYDALRWLKIHNDELVSNRYMWLTILAPAIRETDFSDHSDGEELKHLANGMDPFEAFEFQISLHVNLRFVETKYFSLIENARHKEEG